MQFCHMCLIGVRYYFYSKGYFQRTGSFKVLRGQSTKGNIWKLRKHSGGK